MAFEEKQWRDRVSEYPLRRRLRRVGSEEGIVDVERDEGEVHIEGDTFCAETMNGLENRIAGAITGLDALLDGIQAGDIRVLKEGLATLGSSVEGLKAGKQDKEAFEQHRNDAANPHGVSAAQVGALAVEGTAADAQKLEGYAGAWWVPSGVVAPFAGRILPAGWLLCDGAAVSRTGYPKLFAAIGTQYGVGDGGSTFNLPQVDGRFVLGSGLAKGGGVGGEKEHTLTIDEMPEHEHVLKALGNLAAAGTDAYSYHHFGRVAVEGVVDFAGGSAPHNNMPPYIQMAYMIKI